MRNLLQMKTQIKEIKKEKYIVPSTVQRAIPIQAIYKDGIFQNGNTYSKMFHFEDVNYKIASEDAKKKIFLKYSALLNSFEADEIVQFTIHNHHRNLSDFRQNVIFASQNDGLNHYRDEYNQMLLDHADEGNGIVQDRYITITSTQKEFSMVRNQFSRMGGDMESKLKGIGSSCQPLDCKERLNILHNFYRSGEETQFQFDLQETMRLGHDFKDYICPDSMEKMKDHLLIGKKYCRVLFMKSYARYISDEMVRELCSFDRDMLLTITSLPMSVEKATQMAERKQMGAEMNITNWQQRQNSKNNFSAIVPFQLEQARTECWEFLNDMQNRDQRIFVNTITMVHMADSLEALNNDTAALQSIALKKMCQLSPLTFQQLDGLNTTLPFGLNCIEANRTMTTEAFSAFMPFNTQEINHPHGIYYGQNAVSHNMIIMNRLLLQNANSFILGTSGSGKSMTAKMEITALMLNSDADVIIIDPEREYGEFVRRFGGEVIGLSAYSDNHINAFDFEKAHDETEDRAILRKKEFTLSICEAIIGEENIGAKEKSLLDRCSDLVYKKYQKNREKMPTLKDLYSELKAQNEPLCKELATELELYAVGSLDTFAKETNVNCKSRLVSYDIMELGKDLLTVGMLIVLDNIMNRIAQNRWEGKKTYIFIDEISLLFRHEYSAVFLQNLWKRVRKYGGCCTGLTQNIKDVLHSETARNMINNSEFLVLLNQSSDERPIIANLLNIPNEQLSYISDSKEGNGLLRMGGSLIPFANTFPKDTDLYRLMTTKQDELIAQKQKAAD